MARTTDEVKQSIIEYVESIDPSVDYSKGPVHDSLVSPLSQELPRSETEAEDLRKFYSLEQLEVATDEELEENGYTR